MILRFPKVANVCRICDISETKQFCIFYLRFYGRLNIRLSCSTFPVPTNCLCLSKLYFTWENATLVFAILRFADHSFFINPFSFQVTDTKQRKQYIFWQLAMFHNQTIIQWNAYSKMIMSIRYITIFVFSFILVCKSGIFLIINTIKPWFPVYFYRFYQSHVRNITMQLFGLHLARWIMNKPLHNFNDKKWNALELILMTHLQIVYVTQMEMHGDYISVDYMFFLVTGDKK